MEPVYTSAQGPDRHESSLTRESVEAVAMRQAGSVYEQDVVAQLTTLVNLNFISTLNRFFAESVATEGARP